MKRMKVGKKVRIADPVHLAARFYRTEIQGLVGAGGIAIPRAAIDGPAWIVSVTTGTKGTRGLVAFERQDSNLGMWLDVNDLVEVRR